MRKSTKGTVAASAAALLLLGGLGTHSSWSGSDSIAATQLNTGGIWLTSPCDADTAKSWTFGVGSVGTSLTDVRQVAHDALKDLLLVPGDLLTKTCTFTVHVEGDHLADVKLSVKSPAAVMDTVSGNKIDALQVTSAFTHPDGSVIPDGATVHDGDQVVATIDVSLGIGALGGQNLTGTLDSLTVTASQS